MAEPFTEGPFAEGFQLWPAIDIKEGRFVRLSQGRFDEVTDYGDPLDAAWSLLARGAQRLHVVDLDAARRGEPVNDSLVRRLLKELAVPIQLGGGIRSKERALELLEAGASRVVVGTSVLEQPEWVVELCEQAPGSVVLGLDHREGKLASRGWLEQSSLSLKELLTEFSGLPIAAAVVTDITRDGAMRGPDLLGLRDLLSSSTIPIIASGGIRDLEDLRLLVALREGERTLAGAVVGRALASGALDLHEALEVCKS